MVYVKRLILPEDRRETEVIINEKRTCFNNSFDERKRVEGVRHFLNVDTKAVRFVPISTYHSERKTEDYGSSTAHIFNFEVF